MAVASPSTRLAAAARGLWRHYPRYLPGILLLWFAEEWLVPALSRPGARGVEAAVVGVFLLPLLVRAAAVALGEEAHAHRSLFAFGFSGLYGFGLLALLVFAPVPVLLIHFAVSLAGGISLHQPALVLSAGVFSAAAAVAPLLRLWPVPVVTYLYPGRDLLTNELGRHWIWSGPSFGTAWRMTGRAGALAGATLPWAATTVLVLGGAIGLRCAWAEGVPGLISRALLYGLAVPYAVTASAALARPIRVRYGGFDPGRTTAAGPLPEVGGKPGGAVRTEVEAARRVVPPRDSRPPLRMAPPGPCDPEFDYVPFPPGEGPGRNPMEPGGTESYFVYLTNRNVCTRLFESRPVDGAFLDALARTFEPGYATLYVLEKWFGLAAGEVPPERPELPRRVELVEGEIFCVFQDPGTVLRGSGAVVSRHPTVREAVDEAVRYGREHGVAVAVVRLVEEFPWH